MMKSDVPGKESIGGLFLGSNFWFGKTLAQIMAGYQWMVLQQIILKDLAIINPSF